MQLLGLTFHPGCLDGMLLYMLFNCFSTLEVLPSAVVVVSNMGILCALWGLLWLHPLVERIKTEVPERLLDVWYLDDGPSVVLSEDSLLLLTSLRMLVHAVGYISIDPNPSCTLWLLLHFPITHFLWKFLCFWWVHVTVHFYWPICVREEFELILTENHSCAARSLIPIPLLWFLRQYDLNSLGNYCFLPTVPSFQCHVGYLQIHLLLTTKVTSSVYPYANIAIQISTSKLL